MKSVFVVFVVIFTQIVYCDLLDQLDPNLAATIRTCASLKGVSQDQILALRKLQSPSDTPTQCFLACVAKESELMKSDNTFAIELVLKTIKPFIMSLSAGKNVDTTQIINEIAKNCTRISTSTDKCLVAKNAFDCFIEIGKKNGL